MVAEILKSAEFPDIFCMEEIDKFEEYVALMNFDPSHQYGVEYIPKFNEDHPDGTLIFYRTNTLKFICTHKNRFCGKTSDDAQIGEISTRVYITCIF